MFAVPGGAGGGREGVLRPEGTAGAVRALLAAGEGAGGHPVKRYYCGPMFRRERPQLGRLRQFWQFGVEHLGARCAQADAECVALGGAALERLGVRGSTTLRINSLCDPETRAAHRAALVEHLRGSRERLSSASRHRLDAGQPLRILDSKSEADRACVAGAPTLLELASPASRGRFEAVLAALDALGVPHTVDHTLVRGLDYYTGVVWEWTTEALGAQSAVLAGGRYDGLASALGARRPLPAVGWAAGLDRLVLLREALGVPLPERPGPGLVWVVAAGGRGGDEGAVAAGCLALEQRLRSAGLCVECEYVAEPRRMLRRALAAGAAAVAFVGPDEIAAGCITLKCVATGEQESVPLDGGLEDAVRARL